MKRIPLIAAALVLLAAAVAFSQVRELQTQLAIDQGERNPWNHLRVNNDLAEFQFAVVSDRTGGHRARVFSQAVDRLNLLQPEFVICVGDLIEGGTEKTDVIADEWKEFDGYIAKLQMPFFYVPGNHDISNKTMSQFWQDKFGKRYYHFVYRQVLFLLLNSEDPPGVAEGRFSPEQIEYVKRTLDANKNVRWTVVAFHKPVWTAGDVARTGWLEIEKSLAGRPYTVFVGHKHNYVRFVRNGQKYYQLATTGGSSKMRGTRFGEFDHFAWVTMKKDGPVVANLLVEGILGDDLRVADSSETGTRQNRMACHPVQGKILLDGKPLAAAQIVFHPPESTGAWRNVRPEAVSDETGNFRVTTYEGFDGAPAGTYTLTVASSRLTTDADRPPRKLDLPAAYARPATSPLRVEIAGRVDELAITLVSQAKP